MAASDTTSPIERRSLHAELADRVREMIVRGDLEPGAKIPERELCETFNVSRTPLREALKVLASEGFVNLTPNRGAAVSKLTRADIEEAFPVIGALESLAGELACTNATDEEIAHIARLHAQMAEHYAARERAPYFRLNEQIHDAIAAAARNPTLRRMQTSLASRVRRARYFANISRARWDEAMAEHEEIMEALQAREGKRLAEILKRHLEHKLAAVSAALEGAGE
ncbi:MAG: GntR family transcriptional regulator [Dichotomicrobium sp.]